MRIHEASARDVSVAVLNYNGVAILPDCLRSIEALKHAPAEVLLVDDGSDDGSRELVAAQFPSVRIVEMGENTKRLNRVRNRALSEASAPLVLLVDNDVALADDCLEELLAALRGQLHAAVCMPRAVYAHDPSIIYQDGQVLHFAGASHALHRNEPVARHEEPPRLSIGWGVQLIDRAQAEACDGFNEHYIMGWGDDGEFNHKLNLSGRRCYHVPSAVVLHKRTEGARRYYGTVRNRLRFLLECYQWRTLVLCAPALLVYELALIVFLAKEGSLRDYLRGVGYAATHLGSILAVRRRIQGRRQARDKDLMTGSGLFVVPEYLDSGWMARGYRVLERFLDGYWRTVRYLL